jgi:dipeptidyl aminopeptidase/acylaminoacyl peptidase
LARARGRNVWIVNAYSDREPGETYVWNRHAKTLVSQYRTPAELPRTSLSERMPYHFKSSDGLDIPAYLTLPKGLPAKNLPLIDPKFPRKVWRKTNRLCYGSEYVCDRPPAPANV